MNHLSPKRRQRESEARPVREQLVIDVGGCEWCCRPDRSFYPSITLQVHELANGALRQEALDKPYAILVLCDDCHGTLHRMAKDDAQRAGLAILMRSRHEDYSLSSFLKLLCPNAPKRITDEEVELWSRRIGR